MRAWCAPLMLFVLCAAPLQAWSALDAAVVKLLGSETTDDRIAAIGQLAASQDPLAAALLRGLGEDSVYQLEDGRLLIVSNDTAVDAATGAAVTPVPEARDQLIMNNRLRKVLESAQAGGKLLSPDRAVRLAAARDLQTSAAPAQLPMLREARAKEADAAIQTVLDLAIASASLRSDSMQDRLGAVLYLGEHGGAPAKTMLNPLAAAGADADAEVGLRAAAQAAIAAIDRRLARTELVGTALQGLSLGSVLLLAALGLAITFGLMGIINMAHGELLMIGAYATYVVQSLFRQYLPGAFDWYVIAAIPVAFASSALVGMALERTVIRQLYGRPLETLLCTWGISLILMQTVRTVFGAQNVEVANPSWMSGGVTVMEGLVLPYNRICIVIFSLLVVVLVWLLLNKTRLGLFVRGVTQNRRMADCVGVPTSRIDTLTFGLGSGIAGLGGVALSQIGNVGPDLGQSYIVDSFMVVVLGGVGQLAGTVIAAIGLGELNKFLEPYAGAVLAKITILVFIILFIQKRPQGLFALKGRSAEASA
ncbi:MAG: urea ABC transporter permease subunit UrtB [Betaproteobacteria bacterium]|nr:urea ABC transporter permease subunit UrtB [Betaproteobacteria bacterium]